MHKDTAQQKIALRHSRVAQAVRKAFPEGSRVTAFEAPEDGSMPVGTVTRHVPGLNSQGGILVVRWDSGVTGRHSAGSLRRVDSPPTHSRSTCLVQRGGICAGDCDCSCHQRKA